jgi:hypothetical protein
MKGLKELLTVQNIIAITIVGAGTYFLLKKINNKSKQDLGISEITSSEQLFPTITEEQATAECVLAAANMKMSEALKAEYILRCVSDKLSVNKLIK